MIRKNKTFNDALKELGDIHKHAIATYLKANLAVPFDDLHERFGGRLTVPEFRRKLTFMYHEGISDHDEHDYYFLTENGKTALEEFNRLVEAQEKREHKGAFHYDLDAEKGVTYGGVEHRRRTTPVVQTEQPDTELQLRQEISPEENQELVEIFEEVLGTDLFYEEQTLRAAE